MTTALLRTKLHIPPVRPERVSRPRLIERLNAGPPRKCTLVSAPRQLRFRSSGRLRVLLAKASKLVYKHGAGPSLGFSIRDARLIQPEREGRTVGALGSIPPSVEYGRLVGHVHD
jgi:hypothetical protein